jgi:hypothetical protein
MFRVNRPFKIGKLLKLRINKKSLGLTVGGKYFRTTLNSKGDLTTSAGGAGTGIYLSKKTSLNKKKLNSNATTKSKCLSITKKGSKCKNFAYGRSKYCKTHMRLSPNSIDAKISSEKKGVAVFTYDDLNEKSTQNLKNLGTRLNEIEGIIKDFNEDVMSQIQAKYGDFMSLDRGSVEYRNSVSEYQEALRLKPGFTKMNAEQVDIYKQLLVWEDKVLDSVVFNNFENITYDAATLRRNFEAVLDNM